MKSFKTMFPYRVSTELSYDITCGIHENIFDGLSDGDRVGRGWGIICNDTRIISSDNRLLIKYVEESRKPNAFAVNKIYQERMQKITDDGREVTDEIYYEIKAQAENECIKYAPISRTVVYLLILPLQGLIFCSGSTGKKCEDALGMLRKSIGGLSVEPVSFTSMESRIMADYLSGKNFYKLPESLIIAPMGDVVATELDDVATKCSFSGMNLDEDEIKSVLSNPDMAVRSVEMQLIQKNDGLPIDFKARFILKMPASGNLHFKSFNYEIDVKLEQKRLDSEFSEFTDHYAMQHEFGAEMLIVGRYGHEIITGLQTFFTGTIDAD
ncbi:recombination-associated protein RdgC [Xenorhabdus bovienii]|uniref:recombination-associated protein RdgC n=1 Tax=Xenorhabdus bovienii TaxID=40576 RepID=UPI0023B2239D|nr:recombination-associated protein RdgC [Xenorhabdus bovienii]MDE9495490.1 recombination-associated protein RdgC [Xenorhabdus bovienii]MDE9503914.1 recombination-associated protein RdgC [Xenorhabdus bovienii]